MQRTAQWMIFYFLLNSCCLSDEQSTSTDASLVSQFQDECMCDSSAISDGPCYWTRDGSTLEVHGCGCGEGEQGGSTMQGQWYVVFCGDAPQDNFTDYSTTTEGTPSTTTSCVDKDINGVCDKDETAAQMQCISTMLSDSMAKITKILLLVAFVYIVVWVLLTIIVNIKHKNSGHHRYIQLAEELGIVFLFLSMGALNFFFKENKTACTVLSVASPCLMTFVCACFLFESVFANSMVNNKSPKDGTVPPIANYAMPIVFALIAALVPYFLKKDYYGTTMIHCFGTTIHEVFWAYEIPPWTLIMIAGYYAQMGYLQCFKYIDDQDPVQVYWGYKSCRSVLGLAWFLFGIYNAILFGGDHQKWWLLVLAFIMTLVFGPTLFFVHTYCHKNTAQKWTPGILGIYTYCPPRQRKKPLQPAPAEDKNKKEEPNDDSLSEEPVSPEGADGKPEDPNQPKEEKSPQKNGEPEQQNSPDQQPQDKPDPEYRPQRTHAQAQHFYDWLTDSTPGNVQEESQIILFKPRY